MSTAEDSNSAQILQLLINGDVTNARFQWRRIDESLRAEPQLRAVRGIVAASVPEMLGDPTALTAALAAFEWRAPIAAMVAELRSARTDRMVALVGRVYSTVSIEQFAAQCGLDADTAAARCAAEGWRVEGGIVYPVAVSAAAEPRSGGSSKESGGMRQLEQLTAYVVHLEAESTTKLLPMLELLITVRSCNHRPALRRLGRVSGSAPPSHVHSPRAAPTAPTALSLLSHCSPVLSFSAGGRHQKVPAPQRAQHRR